MDSFASAYSKAQQILVRWHATPIQAKAILLSFQESTLERCSLIIEIDQSLKLAFNNFKNTNGFMTMENHNPYFEGRKPLDMIASGDIETMKAVADRVKFIHPY
ncbi:hypothetical protein [Alteromonas stellipolaris]|uniref:hypothetical protein n=1 Tax=Alteromonas stellipolaris TaxID=233316 RepID=UPI001D2015B7|nr:hypothetical protein [Alteromonas stellipolaris]MBZ2163335.1 hypothetical protein [Alteromonas stellipolaris]